MPIIKRQTSGKAKTTLDLRLLIPTSPGFSKTLIEPSNHSLGDPDYTEEEMIELVQRIPVGGILRTVNRIIRGTRITRVSYEVNLPEGYQAIPEIRAASEGNCAYDLFLYDPCRCSYFHLMGTTVDQVRRRRTPIENPRDTGQPLQYYTTIHGYEVEQRELEAVVAQTAAFPINAIAFLFEDCADCQPGSHQAGVYGGTVAGTPNVGHVRYTDDQFASGTAASGSFNTGNAEFVQAFYVIGNTIYAVSSDTATASASAAGSVSVSTDGGANWSIIHTAATGLFGITYGVRYLWVVGAGGYIARSADLSNFSVVTNTVAAAADLMDVAYEPKTERIYAVGDDGAGNGIVLRISGEAIEDITTTVMAAATNTLYVVKVLSTILDDLAHVAIGGATGYFVENPDLDGSGVWAVATLPTTDDVRAIEGTSYRCFVGAGTGIYERSICTGVDFEAVAGITLSGDVVSGATGVVLDGTNYLAFGTDANEIVTLTPDEGDV